MTILLIVVTDMRINRPQLTICLIVVLESMVQDRLTVLYVLQLCYNHVTNAAAKARTMIII